MVSEPEVDFSRLLIGAIFVQAAIRGGLEICAVQMRMTESLYIYIQTALHCTVNRKKISRNLTTKRYFDDLYLFFWQCDIKNAFDQTLK